MGFFYSNLFFIVPSFMYMLGMNILLIYKIILVTISLCTAISMYLCVKGITKSRYAATISSILYTMCSYRIITSLVKGFVGELLAFVFIPIIILGLYKLIFENEKQWWIFSVGFIGILHSNLVMTEIMIVVSAIIILFNIITIIKNKNRFLGFVKATLLALLLTASFWMPFVEQLCKSELILYTRKAIYNPARWLIPFKDLLSGTIQYNDNMAAACGLGIIFIVILLFRLKAKQKNNITKFCDICLLTALLLLVATSNIFPWKYMKSVGQMIQFASRLDVPLVAFFSVASGIICMYAVSDNKKIKILIVMAIFMWQTISYFICTQSCYYALIEYNCKKNLEETALTETFEYFVCDGIYLPKKAVYLPEMLINSKEKYKTNNEELVYTYHKKGLEIFIKYENNNQKETYIEVPMYYYYGYVATSNITQENYKIDLGKIGKIRIYLGDKEADEIKIYYKSTNIQKISGIITIVTTILLIIYQIKRRKDDRTTKNMGEKNI